MRLYWMLILPLAAVVGVYTRSSLAIDQPDRHSAAEIQQISYPESRCSIESLQGPKRISGLADLRPVMNLAGAFGW
jgi:hypothetical protein